MAHPVRTLLVCILACFVWTPIGPTAAGQGEKLYMHYMPWFQTPDVRGFWGGHWAGFNGEADPTQIVGPDGRRDIHSKYYPLIEPYDTMDRDVLQCQLQQMKLAGIDGVLVDWYGLSSAADYGLIHDGTLVLFDEVGNAGMEFAVVFEDRTLELRVNQGLLPANQVQADLTSMFQWLEANWFNQPQYARFGGRPLVLNFGPIYLKNPTVWNNAFNALSDDPNFFALANLWTQAGADGAFHWVRFDAYNGFPSEATIKQRLVNIFNSTSGNPNLVIPAAFAGFDDDYQPAGQFPYLDHRNGTTLRQALEVSLDGAWPIIQLGTWNDYTEGTMIEPTREFGYTFLEVIQNERAERAGGMFPFDAGDLRLPARLLSLRREGIYPDAALDEVSDLLFAGDVAAAEDAMDALVDDIVSLDSGAVLVEPGGVIIARATVDANPGTFTYRWERDGQVLSDSARVTGSTTVNLAIFDATSGDTGVYRIVATRDGVDFASGELIVGVRQGGPASPDINGDGQVNAVDVAEFLVLVNLGL